MENFNPSVHLLAMYAGASSNHCWYKFEVYTEQIAYELTAEYIHVWVATFLQANRTGTGLPIVFWMSIHGCCHYFNWSNERNRWSRFAIFIRGY